MQYTVKIFPDPEGDGDYIAEVEELKGCSAFGETPEEALKEAEIAAKLWLEVAKEHGKPIPKPKIGHRNFDSRDLYATRNSRRQRREVFATV